MIITALMGKGGKKMSDPMKVSVEIEVQEIADAIIRQLTEDERLVEVVRCKDCKHRPTEELDFPDGKCPCECEDSYYSRYPADDWFCPNGERRE